MEFTNDGIYDLKNLVHYVAFLDGHWSDGTSRYFVNIGVTNGEPVFHVKTWIPSADREPRTSQVIKLYSNDKKFRILWQGRRKCYHLRVPDGIAFRAPCHALLWKASDEISKDFAWYRTEKDGSWSISVRPPLQETKKGTVMQVLSPYSAEADGYISLEIGEIVLCAHDGPEEGHVKCKHSMYLYVQVKGNIYGWAPDELFSRVF